MAQYDKELEEWSKKNVFLDNETFMTRQMSLVPIKILYGNYETYQTQVHPNSNQQWNHLIFLPGTAFKFCNKINEEYTAKNLLSILNIKNIPLKLHSVGHRIYPVFPQALEDTLDMIKVIVQKEMPKRVTIMTWSSGCCHLQEISELLEGIKCSIQRIILVSPLVDTSIKQRKPTPDFLNNNFFQFFEQYYCKKNLKAIQSLSLIHNLQSKKQKYFLIKIPVTIVYGDSQFIIKDIQDFIKMLNEEKQKLGQKQVDIKCFTGENHALYSFITSEVTFQNQETINKLACKKWQVNKYISDQLQKDFANRNTNASLN